MVCRLFDQDYVIDRYGDKREEKGRKEGREEGQMIMLSKLVRRGRMGLSDAAKEVGLSVVEFTHQAGKLGYVLQ